MVDINYDNQATKKAVILIVLFMIIVTTAIIFGKYLFDETIDLFSERKTLYEQQEQYAERNMKPVFSLTNLSCVIQEDCLPRYELSDEEKEMIAIVAYNEDHSSTESMMCVTQVVLNRVESDKFPSTVEDVI